MKLRLIGLILLSIAFQSCKKTQVKSAPAPTPAPYVPPVVIVTPPCYTNPIINNDSGDPYCFRYNGTYYMYRPKSSNNSIIYNTSTDLKKWSTNGTLNFSSKSGAVWAPEVHDIEGTLYLIYADPTGQGGGRDIRICKMESPTSAGSNNSVTVIGAGTADINIDPSVFKDGSNYYLIWKNVGTAAADHSKIMIRQLKSSDATQFAAGSSASVIIPDASGWPLNKEHPFILSETYNSGASTRYFLFFNAGQGDTQDYKINYATATSLMGPYTDKGVMIAKNAARDIYSVGGHSIVRDAGNNPWIIYRAKNIPGDGWSNRYPCMDRIFIDAAANTASGEATRSQTVNCPMP